MRPTKLMWAEKGTSGYSGDGGPATNARLYTPEGVAVDAMGNIYIADLGNHRIRKVDTSGIITTVAGNGTSGYSGDGGPATSAQIVESPNVAVDAVGNIYFADPWNYRIRKVGYPSAFSNILTAGDIVFADDNGEGYVMSSAGLHKWTIDLNVGIVLKEFSYDADNRLAYISDRFGNLTTINRDGSGKVLSITSPEGIATSLFVDSAGSLSRITYADGSYHDFEYNTGGLMTAKIDPRGNRFEHVFDINGRVTNLTDQEGGNWSYFRTAATNGDISIMGNTAEGSSTTYMDHTYSTGAFISTITDPNGAQIQFAQSADGLTVNKDLSCGMGLIFKYDVDPQYKFRMVKEMTERTPSYLTRRTLMSRTYQDTNGDAFPDRIIDASTVNNKTTFFDQDTLQARKALISPMGRTITSFYNPANLLTTQTSVPGLYDTFYGYDNKGRLTSASTNTRTVSFGYNSQGFLSSVVDPENRTTSYAYDPVGRVTQISRPDSSSLSFTYDPAGNMTVLANPSSVSHSFGYNRVNLNNAYVTPLSGSYSYLYDRDRKLIQTTFPSGRQIVNGYSGTRLMQMTTPEGTIAFSYSCGDKVDSIARGADAVSYSYDGSLITGESISGSLNQTLSYSYNNDFRLQSFTYAGDTSYYGYDDDGYVTGAGPFVISRNLNNGLPEAVAGGSLALMRTFNGYGEADGEAYRVGGQGAASYLLSRGNMGRITTKLETTGGITSSYDYAYDPLGRLTGVSRNGALVEQYQYNANGARTYEMNVLRGITGRVLSYSIEDHLLTAGDVTYQYNADGFLTARTQGLSTTSYHYSSRGELLNATLPNGTFIAYAYDPLGRRTVKKTNGMVMEKYLWQGHTRLLAVYDGSDNLIMRFEYGDGNVPLTATVGGITYYLAYDQVGSLKTVADAAGNVVKRIDYDSFGNIITDTNPLFVIPISFAGGQHDRDTNLVRFGYRDYFPEIGRWTAKDPILFAGGDTDLYGYVMNDPVNLVDLWGLYWEYSQTTGQLTYVYINNPMLPDYVQNAIPSMRIPIATGYSGQMLGLNNPALQGIQSLGPIPQGTYNIGNAYRHSRLGPVTMNLTPTQGTNTFGRSLFRIHGDNPCRCQSASEGCMVLSPRNVRELINNSTDRE